MEFDESLIDRYSRYQTGLSLNQVWPSQTDDTCACTCGSKLRGRKTRWATPECQERALRDFWIIKGNTSVIRGALFDRDKGACAYCDFVDPNWQADHILPVFLGGGGCTLENFQTLCISCHKAKTSIFQEFQRNLISSQADSTCFIRLLNDLGALSNVAEKVSTEIQFLERTFSSLIAT